MKAARFIARIRREVRRMVASWTGEYQYTIDQVIENMIKRANEMNLRLHGPRTQQRRLHGHAHGADDELPAQRLSQGGAVTEARLRLAVSGLESTVPRGSSSPTDD